MVYGVTFSVFFKNNTDSSDEEKVNTLHTLSTGDLLTLLRNIEEDPRSFTDTVIQGVYGCLYDKHVMCI